MMAKIMRAILFSVLASGCASNLITVESDPPGADIYVGKVGEIPNKVGQTPLTIPAQFSDLKKQDLTISIEKSGYKKETILLPAASLGHDAKVGFMLREDIGKQSSYSSDESLEEIARGVAQAQESIRAKEFESALNTLNALLVKYKNVATLHGLQGNIYYLQKNIDKALASYKRAQTLAPNSETQRMINKLESFRGGAQ